jgi:hypothetical protein
MVLALVFGIFLPGVSEARRSSKGSVHVRGYFRKDGTYVQPHYRSAPDGNPYNNWSYPGNINPFTGKVATGDPATYLYNYYNHKWHNYGINPSGSQGTLELAKAFPTVKSIASNVTAYDFASNTSNHFTRGVERTASYLTTRRIVGRFTNLTGRSLIFAQAHLYQLGEENGDSRELQSAYVFPTTLNPGQVGYYEVTPYDLNSWSDLAICVTADEYVSGDTTAHYFPVTDLKWNEVGSYFKFLQIRAKVRNDTEQPSPRVDVLVLLKDKDGNLLKLQNESLFSLDPGEVADFSTSVFSDLEGVSIVELVAVGS